MTQTREIGLMVKASLSGKVLVGDLRKALKGVDENAVIHFEDSIATLTKLNGSEINFPEDDN